MDHLDSHEGLLLAMKALLKAWSEGIILLAQKAVPSHRNHLPMTLALQQAMSAERCCLASLLSAWSCPVMLVDGAGCRVECVVQGGGCGGAGKAGAGGQRPAGGASCCAGRENGQQ